MRGLFPIHGHQRRVLLSCQSYQVGIERTQYSILDILTYYDIYTLYFRGRTLLLHFRKDLTFRNGLIAFLKYIYYELQNSSGWNVP